MFNFCVTKGSAFAVLSWRGRDCTRVKVWPVRSRLLRNIVHWFKL